MSPIVRRSLLAVAFTAVALFSAGGALAQAPPADEVFDVRNGDQNGKLLLKRDELAFESLTDSRHSRRWKYAEIRELTKKGSELRVKPDKGSRYDFQFKDKKLRDRIHESISQRILAARHSK